MSTTVEVADSNTLTRDQYAAYLDGVIEDCLYNLSQDLPQEEIEEYQSKLREARNDLANL